MNFRDALLADQGADRMPVDMDRRLRQRLGFETRPRRVWLRPAIAGLAVAAAALALIFYPAKQAHVDRPVTATATITAAPGTRVTRTSENTILLTRGSIEVARKDGKPMFVDVPMGRVVIAAYRSTVTVDPDRVTILLSDGSGHYDDANGKSHPLVANAAFVWPPPKPTAPAIVPPPPRNRSNGTRNAPAPVPTPLPQAPPGETPPAVLPHADMPCTFKSDCDDGQTCRKNERGESVCMGNGADGAACWFDNDCLSQHCVQRRCANDAADQ